MSRRDRRTRRAAEGSGVGALLTAELICVLVWVLTEAWMAGAAALVIGLGLLVMALRS